MWRRITGCALLLIFMAWICLNPIRGQGAEAFGAGMIQFFLLCAGVGLITIKQRQQPTAFTWALRLLAVLAACVIAIAAQSTKTQYEQAYASAEKQYEAHTQAEAKTTALERAKQGLREIMKERSVQFAAQRAKARPGFAYGALKNVEEIQAKRQLLFDYRRENEQFRGYIEQLPTAAEAAFRAAGVGSEQIPGMIREFGKSYNMESLSTLRALDTETTELHSSLLDTLEMEWGRWKYEGSVVVFNDPAAADIFNATLHRIQAVSEQMDGIESSLRGKSQMASSQTPK